MMGTDVIKMAAILERAKAIALELAEFGYGLTLTRARCPICPLIDGLRANEQPTNSD